jgi:hypothetical protein
MVVGHGKPGADEPGNDGGDTMTQDHICRSEHNGIDGMRNLYAKLKVYPTSPIGDMILIRSHIAYWSGAKAAEQCSIKPSRGYSYRVARYGEHGGDDTIVRVHNEYDHREGVTGWK